MRVVALFKNFHASFFCEPDKLIFAIDRILIGFAIAADLRVGVDDPDSPYLPVLVRWWRGWPTCRWGTGRCGWVSRRHAIR